MRVPAEFRRVQSDRDKARRGGVVRFRSLAYRRRAAAMTAAFGRLLDGETVLTADDIYAMDPQVAAYRRYPRD